MCGFKSLITLILFTTIAIQTTNGQKSEPQNSNFQLDEWFLLTGKNEGDPQLYVREFGTGKDTVIMLHGGWGGEHRGLVNAVEYLEDEFKFIFYDQRGSLRSPCPDSLITFQHHVNDLELLRKEFQLEKLVLVGYSMGAVLAGAYAKMYPENIKKLILVAPAYLKEPFPDEDQPLKHQVYLKSKEFRQREGLKLELEKFDLNRTNTPLSSREATMKLRINFAALMLYDITKWTELYNGGPFYNPKVYGLTEKTYPEEGWDYYKEFKHRSYPVSIIIGDHDWIDFEGKLTTHWMKDVPRINLSIIKDAGHNIWLDQKIDFTRELRLQLLK